jgi:glutaconyl-CoA/methylmalonyl-CoA decarboxylase subunit gamma
MKYRIKVDDQSFEVEIEDLNARPVLVKVDGEIFEIWPDNGVVGQPRVKAAPPDHEKPVAKAASPAGHGAAQAAAPVAAAEPAVLSSADATVPPKAILNLVRAPIPGVITAVNVQPGATVKPGQQLCVLEAMKMNNSIRSSREGHIASVHVSVGQHVRHNEVLVEFSE